MYIDVLPDNPTKHSLNQLPDADEVINIIKNIQSEKTVGKDEISGELLKAGVGPLTERSLHLINACWP